MTLKQEKGNRKTRKIDPCAVFVVFLMVGETYNLQSLSYISAILNNGRGKLQTLLHKHERERVCATGGIEN